MERGKEFGTRLTTSRWNARRELRIYPRRIMVVVSKKVSFSLRHGYVVSETFHGDIGAVDPVL